MAQLILKDSGMMIDVADEFGDIDERYFQVVNSEQTFEESPKSTREVWFYCPSTNKFYLNNRKRHGLFNAVKEQFSVPERWDEIETVLDELGIAESLQRLNIVQLRKRLERAELKSLITVDERQKILSVFDHLEVTG